MTQRWLHMVHGTRYQAADANSDLHQQLVYCLYYKHNIRYEQVTILCLFSKTDMDERILFSPSDALPVAFTLHIGLVFTGSY